jgi:hypothetical protein
MNLLLTRRWLALALALPGTLSGCPRAPAPEATITQLPLVAGPRAVPPPEEHGAGYDPPTPWGYSLAPVSPADSIELPPDAPERQVAEALCAAEIDGGHFLHFFRYAGLPARLLADREYVLTSINSQPALRRLRQDYTVNGHPVFIGTYNTQVFSFVTRDGKLELAGEVHLIGYHPELYLLDLLGNGSTQLICSSIAHGGGCWIDIFEPDKQGRLAYFCNAREEWSDFGFSTEGHSGLRLNLIDYDGDGDWEIEDRVEVNFNSGQFWYKDLYYYDYAQRRYVRGDKAFPQYYQAEREFHRKYSRQVQSLLDPDYFNLGADIVIDGKAYSTQNVEPARLARFVVEWDQP